MTMYKKLNCTCNHSFEDHHDDSFGVQCKNCKCSWYDPAGHNPELESVICPQCRLTHMEKKDTLYYCMACNFTLFERQVLEITG